jgi:hypothetical protein
MTLSKLPVRSLALRPGDSLTTPRVASAMGFSSLGLPPDFHPSYGASVSSPVGLTPTERVRLLAVPANPRCSADPEVGRGRWNRDGTAGHGGWLRCHRSLRPCLGSGTVVFAALGGPVGAVMRGRQTNSGRSADLRDAMRDRGSAAVAIAASATLVATVLSARAIAHAQWGPSWEVPARVVMELDIARLTSILLVPTAVGLLAWRARTMAGPVALLLLSAQVVIAGVLAFYASPDQAARWPGRSPHLSRHAGDVALAASLASAVLGTLGVVTWKRSRSPVHQAAGLALTVAGAPPGSRVPESSASQHPDDGGGDAQ